jgi:hypothetical protein
MKKPPKVEFLPSCILKVNNKKKMPRIKRRNSSKRYAKRPARFERGAPNRRYGWSARALARNAMDYVVSPTFRGVRKAAMLPISAMRSGLIEPVVRGTKLAGRIARYPAMATHYGLVRPLMRGVGAVGRFVRKHPRATGNLAAAGMIGLGAAGYLRGMSMPGSEGLANVHNTISDVNKLGYTGLAPLKDLGRAAYSAAMNRNFVDAARHTGRAMAHTAINLPEILWDSGQVIYDTGKMLGSAHSGYQNVGNPGAWWSTFSGMKRYHHLNPITGRWTTVPITPAEIEYYRTVLNIEPLLKTEL